MSIVERAAASHPHHHSTTAAWEVPVRNLHVGSESGTARPYLDACPLASHSGGGVVASDGTPSLSSGAETSAPRPLGPRPPTSTPAWPRIEPLCQALRVSRTGRPAGGPGRTQPGPDRIAPHAGAKVSVGEAAPTGLRAVVFDLDGTVLPPSGVVSLRTRRALAAARAAGLVLVAATGRPRRLLGSVVGQLPPPDAVLAANGALTLRPATAAAAETAEGAHLDDAGLTGYVLTATLRLEVATVVQVIEQLRDALPGVLFAAEVGDDLLAEPDYPVGNPTRVVGVSDLRAVLSAPVDKLLIRHRRPPANFLALADGIVGSFVELTESGVPGLVEVSAPGATKGGALSRLLPKLGVAAESVIGFGDGTNDRSFLTQIGVPVVVRGGSPALADLPARRAEPADRDGVAQVLEEVLLARRSATRS